MAKKQKVRSFRRYSLRAVLIAITLIAIGLAIDRRYRVQLEVVRMLPEGTTVEYHSASIPGASHLFGGYYRDVGAVHLAGGIVTDDDALIAAAFATAGDACHLYRVPLALPVRQHLLLRPTHAPRRQAPWRRGRGRER